MSKSIVLTQFIRIGDRVEVAVDPDAYRDVNMPEDDIGGTVIGFKRYVRHYPRVYPYTKLKPGTYEANGAAIVMWDNGLSGTASAHNMRFEQHHAATVEARRADKQYQAAFDQHLFLSELPHTDIWEDDLVEVISPRLHELWDTNILRMVRINYHNMADKCIDGSPMPFYDVTRLDDGGGTTCVGTEDIQLHQRGNVWNWFNDRSKVYFRDLADEVSFHMKLGLYDEIRNPETELYSWMEPDVIKMYVNDGTIDFTSQFMHSLDGKRLGFVGRSAYKLHDAQLGERARAAQQQHLSSVY